MTVSPKPFVWYELMTSDPAAAQAFYEKVVGFGTAPTEMDYTLLTAGGTHVAGLLKVPAEAAAMGAKPAWIGYVGVDDVDEAAKAVAAAGGLVRRPGQDIPGIGRFAVVADPHGATFLLFKSTRDVGPAPLPDGTPGTIGSRELMAGDLASDFDFYAGQFGWTKAEAIDMGGMGVYQLFATGGQHAAGGMMTKPPAMPAPPHWNYYINVGDIDAAAERVKTEGGTILMGPQDVPGGQFIIQAVDPQGAHFCLVGTRA